MIYDCFTFFNELELLDLRLHELGDVVDRFVLVEATRTHSNKPKPLHYQENRSLFTAFDDRIIHVIVDDMPESSDSWRLENFQRQCIVRGLVNCRPTDFILVSDLDEIPRAAVIAQLSRSWGFRNDFISDLAHKTLNAGWFKNMFRKGFLRHTLRKNHPFILKFEQVLYRHFLNCQCVNPPFWYGTRMVQFRDFSSAEEIRSSGRKVVHDAGWHFSFMGGAERISEKLKAYAHQERNLPRHTNPDRIREQIDRGTPIAGMTYELKIVSLDESFPRYILEHREKFGAWIK